MMSISDLSVTNESIMSRVSQSRENKNASFVRLKSLIKTSTDAETVMAMEPITPPCKKFLQIQNSDKLAKSEICVVKFLREVVLRTI